jgi:glutamate synthase (NADPH/NADH) large chain
VSLLDRQQAFGYTTRKTLKLLMSPMATTGQEAVGSMGTDTPISAMSDKSKLLYTYFKQNFAQVTNPPIDPIREELVMSLVSFIGPRPNLFDLQGAGRRKRSGSAPADPDQWRSREDPLDRPHEDPFRHQDARLHLCRRTGRRRHADALERLCERAEAAVHGGYNIIILSDRQVGPDRIAIPALLATAGVHHHLIRKGLRTSVGLVVEPANRAKCIISACWPAIGAEAINPYLAFDTLTDMHKRGDFPEEVDADEVVIATSSRSARASSR